jgi:hypothetical protein
MVDLVSDTVVLQYVGFENRGVVREYTFTLRGSGGTSTEYFVVIANAAFLAHHVRYQDGPDICSVRLHRSLPPGRTILGLHASPLRMRNWPNTSMPTLRSQGLAPLRTEKTKSFDITRFFSCR